MRILILCLLLSGCSGQDFNYGPAEYLHDTTGVGIQSIHEDYYEKLWNPEIITITYNTDPCDFHQKACAFATPERCDVYLPERHSPSLRAHELKHCYGWTHYEPDPSKDWEREVRLSRAWYPAEEHNE